MWHTLALHNLPPADWLWGGDWNVVELQVDRSLTFIGTTMTRSEQGAWSNFLMWQGLMDVYSSNEFSKTTEKHFTWQGKRRNKTIFSRIDRFYATQGIHALGGNTGEWTTQMGISDHAPVHCQINKVMKKGKPQALFHGKLLRSQEGISL